MTFRASLLLCAALVFIAWTPLPTSVTPDVQLDLDTSHHLGTELPRIAAIDGQGALVVSGQVWLDHGGWPAGFTGYGAALDANGAPIQGRSTFLRNVGSAPVIGTNGRGYLAASSRIDQTDLVRFSPSGQRLDRDPITIATHGDATDIAWDGSQYVLINSDENGNRATLLAEDGRVLQSAIVVAGQRVASRNGLSVIAGSTNGLLSIQTLQAGAAGDKRSLGNGIEPAIAASDAGFLLTYTLSGSVWGRLLDASGALDGDAFLIANDAGASDVAWNGHELIVAFEQLNAIRGVRVLRAPLGDSFLIAPSGKHPSIDTNGTSAIVAWEEPLSIATAKIDGEQVTRNGIIDVIGAQQSNARMTAVDGASLLVWHDGELRARRMDGVSAARKIPLDDFTLPIALTSNGSEALLVTADLANLDILRLDRDGALLSSAHFARARLIRSASAVWLGNEYFVTWTELAPDGDRITGLRVSADGVPIGTPKSLLQGMTTLDAARALSSVAAGDTVLIRLSTPGNVSQALFVRNGVVEAKKMVTGSPLLASNGAGFLLTRIANDTLQWSRYLPDGALVSSGEVPLGRTYINHQVFWTGENYLVLFWTVHPASVEFDALRMASNGQLIDSAPKRIAAFNSFSPGQVRPSMTGPQTIDFTYYRWIDDLSTDLVYPRLYFRSLRQGRQRSIR